MAAKLAKINKFDYISYKPFLTRADVNNAEVVELTKEEQHIKIVMNQIRKNINKAKEFEGEGFKVIESTNLKVLENGTYRNYTKQPKNCHMQFFRQIISPFGVFNCPVYRNVPQATIGTKNAYVDSNSASEATFNTLKLIDKFDARKECKDVTCLYNHANWFIEDLINNPDKLNNLESRKDRKDYYL